MFLVVKELRNLFCWNEDSLLRSTENMEECRGVMAAVCRLATPSALVTILQDIANDKVI